MYFQYIFNCFVDVFETKGKFLLSFLGRSVLELICLPDKSCAFEMELNYIMSWGLPRKIRPLVDLQFGNVQSQKRVISKADSLSLLRKKIEALNKGCSVPRKQKVWRQDPSVCQSVIAYYINVKWRQITVLYLTHLFDSNLVTASRHGWSLEYQGSSYCYMMQLQKEGNYEFVRRIKQLDA